MAAVERWHYSRPKSSNMSGHYYRESVEQAARFNTRIMLESRQRLPFLDSQTGVAQNHTALWHPYRYRSTGSEPGRIYSYPAKRWRKSKPFPPPDYRVPIKPVVVDKVPVPLMPSHEKLWVDSPRKYKSEAKSHFVRADVPHQIQLVENLVVKLDHDPKIDDMANETSKDRWYDELDDLSDPPDAGEIDERNSDSSDYEETYVKKRKKKKAEKTKGEKPKKGGPGRGRKSAINKDIDYRPDDTEKPYGCDMCGARYKTRPGLTYHLTHFHQKNNDYDDDGSATPSPKVPSTPSTNGKSRSSSAAAAVPVPPPRGGGATTPTPSDSASNKQGVTNNYCDFCLGDESENKKTGQKEELVSCADCGRSGHPSCLQFTANMIISVKKYPWQCIECKSCGLCGTSDNDDQLLFCDDCDRGYHMYCLNPPLSEPPEGSWSCHLCIKEFYGGKKPEGMQ